MALIDIGGKCHFVILSLFNVVSFFFCLLVVKCKSKVADRIRNEEVHRMAGTSEDVTVRMKKKVLSWFVHVQRMSDERMAKKIYGGKVSGKRGRGRSR